MHRVPQVPRTDPRPLPRAATLASSHHALGQPPTVGSYSSPAFAPWGEKPLRAQGPDPKQAERFWELQNLGHQAEVRIRVSAVAVLGWPGRWCGSVPSPDI